MSLDPLDQLLIFLVDQPRNVPLALRSAGFTQSEISQAWTDARSARYTEPTGLGMDRLTASGRVRASTLLKSGGDKGEN